MCRAFRKLAGFGESFLGTAGRDFVPHVTYFLKQRRRWSNSDQILDRILASVPTQSAEAWETWRHFRSAQTEITSIFLVENYFLAQVTALEVTRPGLNKSCDIRACVARGIESYLEVKAQSGQQHGDEHPLSGGRIECFVPDYEEDLRSWLFEARISSRTRAPMDPLCHQASVKGADVLIAMTDIFPRQTDGPLSLGKFLAPDHGRVITKNVPMRGILVRLFQKKLLRVFIFEAGQQTSIKLGTLRELWLFHNSNPSDMVILRAKGAQVVFPIVA